MALTGHQPRERREHKIFIVLLQSVAGLEERLLTGSEEETGFIAELIGFLYETKII